MSLDYQLHDSMPDQWHAHMYCDKNIIYSKAWSDLLKQAFNTDTYYLTSESDNAGNCISIFRKGPFRIGYINFPVGICADRNLIDHECLQLLRARKIAHVINCPISSLYQGHIEQGDQSAITHETVIRDLDKWDISKTHQSIRRGIKKSLASDLEFIFIENKDYVDPIYRLYYKTIKHHDGALRYKRQYFEALIELSRRTERLRLTGLLDNNYLVAFLAVILHENTSFYLHGSHDRNYNDSRPMHHLFNESITYCRDYGLASYNFMSSPIEQSGLSSFKERWGGNTYNHQLISYFTTPLYGLVYNAARRAERLISSI